MNSSPMTNAGLTGSTRMTWLRPLAVLLLPLATGLVLAAVGAFGSYTGMKLSVRFIHFATNTVLIGGLIGVVTLLVRRLLFGGRLHPFWVAVVIAIVMAPPGAWIVHRLLLVLAPQVVPYVTMQELASQVLTINLFVGTVAWLIQRMPTAQAPDKAADTGACTASGETLRSFRMKLPLPIRGATLLCMSAEDHYVRVRTDLGHALILINLSDAIAALGEDAGIRIHRSHWVAQSVALMTDGKRQIRLDDGTILPISRSGRTLLRNLREES